MTGRACKSLPLFPALQSISTTLLPRLDRVPAGTADMRCAESQRQHLKVENKMVGGEMKKLNNQHNPDGGGFGNIQQISCSFTLQFSNPTFMNLS